MNPFRAAEVTQLHVAHSVAFSKNKRGRGGAVGEKEETYPNVYFWSRVLLPFEHLGSGVGRRAAPRGQQLPALVKVGETKVGDLDVHAGVQQEILGLETGRDRGNQVRLRFINIVSLGTYLQIPVDNVPVVTIFDGGQDLPELVASSPLVHAAKPSDVICGRATAFDQRVSSCYSIIQIIGMEIHLGLWLCDPLVRVYRTTCAVIGLECDCVNILIHLPNISP